jgi:hypothetical protein
VSGDPAATEIEAQIHDLEELARELRTGDLTPERVKDLADRALEIAERVSALAGEVRLRGGSDAPAAGP